MVDLVPTAELLDREGSTIRLHELTGDEGFASTELLVRRVLEDQTSARWQILDLRRVSRVDTAGLTLLAGLLHRLSEDDVTTALVEPRSPSARATLRDLPGQVARFSDTEAALEWCETQLLEAHGLTSDLPDGLVPFPEHDLLEGLSPVVSASAEAGTTTRVFTAGSVVFDEGDPADGLYFIGAGQVSAEVRTRDGRSWRRLSTITAGGSFGELALVDGQRRSTRIVALEPTICHVLAPTAYAQLQTSDPGAWAQLTLAIARSLPQRLRSSTADVASLEAM